MNDLNHPREPVDTIVLQDIIALGAGTCEYQSLIKVNTDLTIGSLGRKPLHKYKIFNYSAFQCLIHSCPAVASIVA